MDLYRHVDFIHEQMVASAALHDQSRRSIAHDTEIAEMIQVAGLIHVAGDWHRGQALQPRPRSSNASVAFWVERLCCAVAAT